RGYARGQGGICLTHACVGWRPDCIDTASRLAYGEEVALKAGTLYDFLEQAIREAAMPATYKILIMGASYGSLLASKILFGGHSVHLVCLPAEADLIN